MNKKITTLFWGIVLILAGSLALAETMDLVENLAPVIWITIFATISLFSAITYFVTGIKNWGWLFPTGIFGALALITTLAVNGVTNAAIGAPLFVGIGLPFVVAYFLDRSRNWWALIPAGVMTFLTLVLLVVENLAGEWIGAGVLFFLGAIFLLVFLGNRVRLWAALVAYIMFVVGFMPLIALTPRPELAGIAVLFAIGLPFLAVYFSSPNRWWAVIPGGILLTSGIVLAFVLVPGLPGPDYNPTIPNALMLTGLAATLAVVWLRHGRQWAKFVCLIMACLAVLSLFAANDFVTYAPLIAIAGGIYLLFRSLRTRTV